MFSWLKSLLTSQVIHTAVHSASAFGYVAASSTVANLINGNAFVSSAPTSNQLYLALGVGVLSALRQVVFPCPPNQVQNQNSQGGQQ
jgi:hypothetical protein